jgi:hypothetical protein
MMKSTTQRKSTDKNEKKNLTVKERLEYRCPNTRCEQHYNTAKTPEQKKTFKIMDNTCGSKCGCCGSGLEYNISQEENSDKRKRGWVKRSGVDREFKEKPQKIEKGGKLQKILPKIAFNKLITKMNEKTFCHKIEKLFNNIEDFSEMENNENVELNCLNSVNNKNIKTDFEVQAENVHLEIDEPSIHDVFQTFSIFDNIKNREMIFSENTINEMNLSNSTFDDDWKNEINSFEKEIELSPQMENIQVDPFFEFDFMKEKEEWCLDFKYLINDNE